MPPAVTEPAHKDTSRYFAETGPLLEMKDVTKSFGGLKVITGINFSVAKGELLCLIGPNGAGKSTIFKMIIGEYPPTSGKIIFNNREITKLPMHRRAEAGISIKMQIPGIFAEMTAYDNMRVALQYRVPRDQLKDEIERLLDKVGFTGDTSREVKNLSHGEIQWLEIAMALGSRPSLLLLDEPTAGMGPNETEKTAELVLALNAEGVTTVVVEHDMAFIRQIAKRVIVLHYGTVFAEGTMEEIEANEDVVRIYLGEL